MGTVLIPSNMTYWSDSGDGVYEERGRLSQHGLGQLARIVVALWINAETSDSFKVAGPIRAITFDQSTWVVYSVHEPGPRPRGADAVPCEFELLVIAELADATPALPQELRDLAVDRYARRTR